MMFICHMTRNLESKLSVTPPMIFLLFLENTLPLGVTLNISDMERSACLRVLIWSLVKS
ncbi:Uncharacterised protein [Mycobacterium tuberculosis]|nr:Uncharacterised protein [Mycobacterium tuberculosis]